MPEKPNSTLAWIVFPFFILTGIASFTEPNTSVWFKILMGIAVLLSAFGLGEKIYCHLKNK